MSDENENRVAFLRPDQINAAHAAMWERVAKERAARIEELERERDRLAALLEEAVEVIRQVAVERRAWVGGDAAAAFLTRIAAEKEGRG